MWHTLIKSALNILIFILLFSSFVYAQDFKEDVIIVGGCKVNVFVAETQKQKSSGMLGFTDESFSKDGMIFVGTVNQKQYYHTVGMKMDIRIMGVNTIGNKRYKVNNGAVYAPPGKRVITVLGDSVFEVPERLYQQKFKDCLYLKELPNE